MLTLSTLLATTALALGLADDTHSHNVASQDNPGPTRADLGNDLYMITGFGGNILFSTGEDGTFVIDDQMADAAEANLDLINEVSDEPVVFVLNTHHHFDHTGGNSAFVEAGATVLAHDNVRKRLEASEDMTENGLPVITFSETTTFHWNGKEIHVFHMPGAHTDGDALVHFRKTNVIHTGDTMFSGLFPYVDLGSGGSLEGVINALTKVSEIADDETQIVPGHGPLSDRQDVLDTIEMLKDARRLVRTEMMKGLDRDAVIAANPLAKYEDYSWHFISTDRMVGQTFDDLTASDEEARAAVEGN